MEKQTKIERKVGDVVGYWAGFSGRDNATKLTITSIAVGTSGAFYCGHRHFRNNGQDLSNRRRRVIPWTDDMEADWQRQERTKAKTRKAAAAQIAEEAAERQADKEALEYALMCVDGYSPGLGSANARARAILQRLIENPDLLR